MDEFFSVAPVKQTYMLMFFEQLSIYTYIIQYKEIHVRNYSNIHLIMRYALFRGCITKTNFAESVP